MILLNYDKLLPKVKEYSSRYQRLYKTLLIRYDGDDDEARTNELREKNDGQYVQDTVSLLQQS